ncbi:MULTISPECIES: hypothetical protein [Serratia]|uniref:hypothetical protein n=1 Tax=unclassified Serratia (in: enterobacteria) TaxID=2647522 RepID=UPI001EF596BD|nr:MULTISPECIES: hypothetical protein [Serratia]UTN94587.1 hypothetical protein NLX81_13805 [Serratia plymuthica]
MHGNFRFDRDGGACDFAVASILTADLTRGDCLGVAAFRWRVVAEAVERVFAGVEAARTGFYLAFVLKRFAHLKLKAATGEVLLETFIGSGLHSAISLSRG